VDDLALKVDQKYDSVLHKMRGKKRKPRRGALRLTSAQANAPALEGVLLGRRHDLVKSNDGARTEGGKAGEQCASLQRPGFTVDHLMVSVPSSAPATAYRALLGWCRTQLVFKLVW
jgi:hypothetical protein